MSRYSCASVGYDDSAPTDPLRSVDIYTTSENSQDLLVFIHGGAWRVGDKQDHRNIPTYFEDCRNPPTIAIPNYRLSHHPDHPERINVMHPTHILDVFRSLLFLLFREPSPTGSRASRVYLAGHSCGAHILSFILAGLPGLHLSEHEVSVTPTLRTLITGYVFLDGIYDLEDLIHEYPSYAFFVEKAFGGRAAWAVGSIKQLPERPRQRLLVAHSRNDDLLTTRQSRNWYELLKSSGATVEWDDETLQGKHDECLQNEGLGKLLRRFMNR